jgi:tetratricopeptide (TPR) repeat protein
MSENSLGIRRISGAVPNALAEAQSLAQRGRFDDALGVLNAALSENPELAPAHLLKGLIHWRRRELAAAERELELAVRLDAEKVDAWHALAAVRRELEVYPQALVAVDEALKLEAEHAEAHLLRGEILLKLERPRRAKAALLHALKHKPTLTAPHLHLARMAIQGGQSQTAYRRVQALQHLGTQHYETALEIGSFLAELDRADEAIPHYRRMIREFPTRAAPYIKLAELFLEEGHDLEAMPLLSLATKMEPRNTTALLHLAGVFRRQGRAETAAELTHAAHLADPALAPPATTTSIADAHASP